MAKTHQSFPSRKPKTRNAGKLETVPGKPHWIHNQTHPQIFTCKEKNKTDRLLQRFHRHGVTLLSNPHLSERPYPSNLNAPFISTKTTALTTLTGATPLVLHAKRENQIPRTNKKKKKKREKKQIQRYKTSKENPVSNRAPRAV